jgi:hypothetical protein
MAPEVPGEGSELAGYRIVRPLGRGGMGVVYLAEQLRLGRLVALKIIAPELSADATFRARFERESRVAASIDHPNVVPVYEADEADGLLFIAMRYVEGTDLRGLITSSGRLEPARAANLVAQVGSALDVAHARGLVHRDVKPANVLVTGGDGSEHAYLTDFGLTKQVGSQAGGLTVSGQWVGTVDYVAPEQVSGGAVSARSDVYSLGCVLHHCVTGTVPYPHDSDMAKLYAHVHGDVPSPRAAAPDVPDELDRVIRRALAKDPAERFPSAGDLGRAAQAGAARRAPTQPERSVAVGPAASGGAPAPPPAPTYRDAPAVPAATHLDAPPPAARWPSQAATHPLSPARERRSGALALAIVAAAAILAAGGAAVALIATRDGDGDGGGEAAPASETQETNGREKGGGGGSTTPAASAYGCEHYTAEIPADWSLAQDCERQADPTAGRQRYVTELRSGSSMIVIDTTTNYSGDPMEGVTNQEDDLEAEGGRTESVERTTVNGQRAVDWIYTKDGRRWSDLFFNVGGNGFAVLASARPGAFRDVHELARTIAESVR